MVDPGGDASLVIIVMAVGLIGTQVPVVHALLVTTVLAGEAILKADIITELTRQPRKLVPQVNTTRISERRLSQIAQIALQGRTVFRVR